MEKTTIVNQWRPFNEHDIVKIFLGILMKFQLFPSAFKAHNLLITRKIESFILKYNIRSSLSLNT